MARRSLSAPGRIKLELLIVSQAKLYETKRKGFFQAETTA
jgi:hypothetical protein